VAKPGRNWQAQVPVSERWVYLQEHPGGQTGGQLEEELLLFPGVIIEILPKT